MARYHINDKGEPGQCRAQKACPFGPAAQHYDSASEARQAYEEAQTPFGPSPVTTSPAALQTGNFAYLPDGEEGTVLEVERMGSATYVWLQDHSGRRPTKPIVLDQKQTVSIEALGMDERQIKKVKGAHPLSPSATGPFKAYDIAEDALRKAGNESVTEYDSNGDYATFYFDKSWQAGPAEAALKAQGWTVEKNPVNQGQGTMLRVSDPETTSLNIVNTKNLLWNEQTGSFVAETSELPNFDPTDFTLVSQKNGAVAPMRLVETLRNERENETDGWVFTPAHVNVPWTVTVFND